MIEQIWCGFGKNKCYYRPRCLTHMILESLNLMRYRFRTQKPRKDRILRDAERWEKNGF